MEKSKRKVAFGVFGCLALALVLGITLAIPTQKARAAEAPSFADDLFVRYDMGDIEGGKIKASKWNGTAYAAESSLDATITGTIERAAGLEGNGAGRITAGAYADIGGTFTLPQGANGFTVSAWTRNVTDDWSGLIEIADETDGARFGKGTIQRNGGKLGEWAGNFWPALSNKFANGGDALSFVVAAQQDNMSANTWYQVTVTVEKSGNDVTMKMYRDGLLKITYDTGEDGNNKVQDALQSIFNAATSGNGKLRIRGFLNTTAANDEIDDLRIYKKALTDAEVATLYGEYDNDIRSDMPSFVTDDAVFGDTVYYVGLGVTSYTVDVCDATSFPKLLLGGATDVTESNGTYTGVGGAVRYSYTISNDVATLKYTGTSEHTVTVSKNVVDVTAGMKNDQLLVHYDMGDIADGKIKASKWDSAQNAYVPYTEMDAKISGTVEPLGTAAVMGANAYADVAGTFTLPSGATGLTVSVWTRNLVDDWSGLIEIADETNGARFGKGTIQRNNGVLGRWGGNYWPALSNKFTNGGGALSFVVGTESDCMKADTWYQVTVTLEKSGSDYTMKMYRDGVLKITYDTGNTDSDISDKTVQGALKSIFNAATSGKGKIRLHGFFNAVAAGNEMDDLRIYKTSLTDMEVETLYKSSKGLRSQFDAVWSKQMSDKAVTGTTGYPTLDLANNETTEGAVRKGTFGDGVSYSYTPIADGTSVTKANDDQGVQVKLTQGSASRVCSVKYVRTFTLAATKLGYKVGSADAATVDVEAGTTAYTVRVPVDTDLTAANAITAGTSTAAVGNVTFAYDSSTATATYTVRFADYTDLTATYTIKFEKMSADSTLSRVTVTGDLKGSQSLVLTDADFGVNKSTSLAVADMTEFELTLTFELPDGASVSASSAEKELTLTQADITDTDKLAFTVYAEDVSKTTVYTFELTDKSSDASLKTLSITGFTLRETAQSGIYAVTLPTGADAEALIESIVVVPNNTGATVASIEYFADREELLPIFGTKEGYEITVRAEDYDAENNPNSYISYGIVVLRASADATLSGIKLGGVDLEGFASATDAYTLKYNSDALAEWGQVTATATDADANVAVGDLTDGKVVITVTAAIGSVKTYTITFVRRSADTALASVTVNGNVLTVAAGVTTYVYKVTEAVDLTALDVVAVAADASATVAKQIDAAENLIHITVTAENGTVARYAVSVVVEAAPAPAGKSGCGSATAASALGLAFVCLAFAAAAVLIRRRASAE